MRAALLLALGVIVRGDECPTSIPNAKVAPGFCAESLVENLSKPRGLAYDPRDGNVLVVERNKEQITLLTFDDDGKVASAAAVASAPDLNHGVALRGETLYASSDTTVYRWRYAPGAEATDRTAVVTGISADGRGGAPGGHTTRTLVLDGAGHVYVSVGSAGNVDADSYRSRVRACGDLSAVADAVDFDACAVFADGLRNEVGLAFDAAGRLWGVENSADNLRRSDLGGDIHNENPAEELNLLVDGGFYGYPWCWTGGPNTDFAGAQWAWPSTMETKDDGWCADNSVPPALAMQAHSAPLGLAFYETVAAPGAFPADADGDCFVAFHGSWNRDVPTGYKVVRVRFADGAPASIEDLLAHDGDAAKWPNGLRPVDAVFDGRGRLVVSDDGANTVFRISASPATARETPAPTTTIPDDCDICAPLPPPPGESDATRRGAAWESAAGFVAATLLLA